MRRETITVAAALEAAFAEDDHLRATLSPAATTPV